MSVISNEVVDRVLACLNRSAGTSLVLPPSGDLPVAQFGLNSFSTLAFIVDLEQTFGIEVDEPALTDGSLGSVQRVAQYVVQRGGKAA